MNHQYKTIAVMDRLPKKPLKLNRQSCDNISSNCVTWQGPDIDCLNLCKGDSITQVIYEVATEFCNLYAQLNPEAYDLECLDINGCPPETFKELFQILINRSCNQSVGDSNPCSLVVNITPTLNGVTSTVSGGSGDYTYKWSIPQNSYLGGKTIVDDTLQTIQFNSGSCTTTGCAFTTSTDGSNVFPQASFWHPLYLLCWVTDNVTGCTQQGTYFYFVNIFN